MANFLRATEIAWDQLLAAVVGVQLSVYLMRMDPAKTPLIRTNDAMSCTDRGGPSLWNSLLEESPTTALPSKRPGTRWRKLARLLGCKTNSQSRSNACISTTSRFMISLMLVPKV